MKRCTCAGSSAKTASVITTARMRATPDESPSIHETSARGKSCSSSFETQRKGVLAPGSRLPSARFRTMTQNRLKDSASPYLRSAAHQPIDWYEWNENAFVRAKNEDKPILLDIGAVWCHWCHVIDRESYENPEIAKIINELFVPVKVDRDERPDVDSRYQSAISTITGQGGWPLTGFLMPDGRPFYGGTYFPPKISKAVQVFGGFCSPSPMPTRTSARTF